MKKEKGLSLPNGSTLQFCHCNNEKIYIFVEQISMTWQLVSVPID